VKKKSHGVGEDERKGSDFWAPPDPSKQKGKNRRRDTEKRRRGGQAANEENFRGREEKASNPEKRQGGEGGTRIFYLLEPIARRGKKPRMGEEQAHETSLSEGIQSRDFGRKPGDLN